MWLNTKTIFVIVYLLWVLMLTLLTVHYFVKPLYNNELPAINNMQRHNQMLKSSLEDLL